MKAPLKSGVDRAAERLSDALADGTLAKVVGPMKAPHESSIDKAAEHLSVALITGTLATVVGSMKTSLVDFDMQQKAKQSLEDSLSSSHSEDVKAVGKPSEAVAKAKVGKMLAAGLEDGTLARVAGSSAFKQFSSV